MANPTATHPVLYSAKSPAPKLVLGPVTLYKHTWDDHISVDHSDVPLQGVTNGMADPCLICESKTVAGRFVFVNTLETNDLGQELRIPVDPQADGVAVVTTSYYAWPNSHGNVVWRRP